MTSVITASLPRFQTPTDVLLRDVSGVALRIAADQLHQSRSVEVDHQ